MTAEIPQVNFSPVSAWELLYEDIPEPQWLIDGWVPEGEGMRVMFGGAPKASKSTLAFELAVSLATHSPFLGIYPLNSGETYNVLYIQEENSPASMRRDVASILNARGAAKVWEREEGVPIEALVQWDPGHAVDLANLDLLIHSGFRLSEAEHVMWLIDTIKENKYQYVFLDSLYRLVPGYDLDKGWQASNVLDVLDMLRIKTGVSVVVIHHAGKTRGSGAAGDRLMHSTYLRAWYDLLIFPEKKKDYITVSREVRELEEPDPISIVQHSRGEWEVVELEEKASRESRINTINMKAFTDDAFKEVLRTGSLVDAARWLNNSYSWGVSEKTIVQDIKNSGVLESLTNV